MTIRGEHLPFFAQQTTVTVAGTLRCSRVRILTPYRKLSCVMPECPQCGTVPLVVVTRGAHSNPFSFGFASDCYEGLTPDLPHRYSAEENCTICRESVAVAASLLPDASSFESVLLSLRDACQSDYLKSYGPLQKKHCRIDISNGCAILFHTHGTALGDAIWSYWDDGDGEMYGALPETVCAAVGRCPAV